MKYVKQCLTYKDLKEILATLNPQLLAKRHIKYANFDYDNRTRTFWRIVFRFWGGKEKVFTNTNRPFEERRDLFEEIMEWFNGSNM